MGATLQNIQNSNPQASSLKARTLALMAVLIVFLVLGLVLLLRGQTLVSSASKQIRETLLPASRLFEQAKTEIDLQIQEVSLLSSAKNPAPPVTDQNMGLLRLGPATKTLLTIPMSPQFPPELRSLFNPWVVSLEKYNQKVPSFETINQAIPDLKDIRQKTQLLHRAVDRATSLELLKLSEKSTRSVVLWLIVFAAGVFLFLCFAFLIWRWLSPLKTAEIWLRDSLKNHPAPLLPPPAISLSNSRFWGPPREIQSLVSALKHHVEKFRAQKKLLETDHEKNTETEKALVTLFSTIQVLSKNNEDLTQELIKNEKLASMGEMAAQLAHEIRNPLNSLNLKLELLREKLTEEQKPVLDRVLKEIDRLDALSESYLRTTKARLKDIVHSEQQISAWGPLIEGLEETFFIEFQKLGVEFNTKNFLGLENPEYLDPKQSHEGPYFEIPLNILKAVLLNLVKNSKESIEANPQIKDKKIFLELRLTSKSSNLAEISVYDTGSGFDKTLLSNVFEGFRTTKAQGSGLGLKTSQTMLAAFGAELSILDPKKLPHTYNAGICIKDIRIKKSFSKDANSENPVSRAKIGPTL